MKLKIIAWIEFVLLLVLAALLVTRFISIRSIRPVVREPLTPAESTLKYTPLPPPKPQLESLGKLAEMKEVFTPRLTKVTHSIYHATGYALGNVQMVITRDGLVIIDTTESPEAAREILNDFRKITDKPIRYIIYTHGHFDHVFGSTVFLEKGTEVISTRDTADVLKRSFVELRGYQDRSRHIQFGGIAEAYAFKRPIKSPVRLPAVLRKKDIVWPTITFDREYSFTLGGKKFELFHTTGETPDHLMVWLPDEKALFSGDLYYLSFPNLSTPMLRPRPVKGWYESLDRMIALKPDHLIPGHTAAISGAEKVRETLIVHSRAIRHLYEQTITCINEGKTVEEAVTLVRLPPELARKKQLREAYGRVDWSVRGIYQGETGWYDGHGTGLSPLPPRFRSRELIRLAGGADKLLNRAVSLQLANEHQLACELCDVVILANPDDKTARLIKASSLDYLAYMCGNMNMFEFYRSAAALERQAAGFRP
jgi:alkyl sulfatase BDS1-like metallo-beta-lactamase superfamily hydrolase